MDRAAELDRRRATARGMGGSERLDRLRAEGRLDVRHRVATLVDEGSWFEIGLLAEPERRLDRPVPGDGVVTGHGEVDGRAVGVIALDPSVLAGTTAPISMKKQGRIARSCAEKGFPLVVLADADGGRIPDVVGWRFSALPFDFSEFLQVGPGRPDVPRVTVVLGPAYGDAGLHAASADLVVMTESAAVGLSGPPVIAEAIGEVVADVDLGGPVAAMRAGNVHLVADGETAAIGAARDLLSYLPGNAGQPAPSAEARPPARPISDVGDLVPEARRRGYDMRKVLESVFDEDTITVLAPRRGPGVITAFARLDGGPVGVVASQPMQRAGVLDPPALAKLADFVDLCDRFNLPLVFLQDVPGLMVGQAAEADGVLRGYERLAGRLARAEVPKLVVVIRKAYGGGHFALGGRPTKPDFVFAWPGAEFGFMAPEPGVRTVYRRRLDEMAPEDADAFQEARVAEWEDESAPWEAAAHLALDDIIHPAETRATLITALRYAWPAGERVTGAGR